MEVWDFSLQSDFVPEGVLSQGRGPPPKQEAAPPGGVASRCWAATRAPLIWGIFKGPSTGSESQWGNCPAQQIQLQQAVSPRRKIFTIIFCQEVKSLLTIQPNFFYPFLDPFVKILGLLVWTRLIFGSIPCNFQKFLNKGKNCPQKNEGYFDQNRPKSAMRVFAKVARHRAHIY